MLISMYKSINSQYIWCEMTREWEYTYLMFRKQTVLQPKFNVPLQDCYQIDLNGTIIGS